MRASNLEHPSFIVGETVIHAGWHLAADGIAYGGQRDSIWRPAAFHMAADGIAYGGQRGTFWEPG